MRVDELQISFQGMEPTDSLKEYVLEKLQRHEVFLVKATSGDAVLRENIHSRGVDKDFKIDLNITFPKSIVRVEEKGSDMYAVIDVAVDTLGRRIKRYFDKQKQWEGEIPWKVLEAEEELKELGDDPIDEVDNYADYIPKIVTRKKLTNMRPLDEAEAIERMELMGYSNFFFKNNNTGKFSMLYKRENGGYGIVEPGEDLE